MNQGSADKSKPELLFHGDLERLPSDKPTAVFKVAFSKPVAVQQLRIVRGGNMPHLGMKESVTQRGEEIEKLEIFARKADERRGFVLLSSSDRISEKGNHDTVIPIDPNYTVSFRNARLSLICSSSEVDLRR
jgi:hypothetical protein